MKRKTLAALSAALIVLTAAALLLTGCTKGVAAESDADSPDENVISAQIVSVSDGSLLVTADSGLYFVSADEKTAVSKDGKQLDKNALKPGMTVMIRFDGTVLESYPAQIPNTEAIKVTAEGEDKISLYAEAAKHIFEMRLGKDFEKDDIETVALDLTQLSSLSKAEKSALEYVLDNYFYTEAELNVIRSSYSELSDSGMLDKNGEFKNGVIIALKDGEHKKSFSLSLVAGSTCGYGYGDCTATLKNGEWKINYGGVWIS